MGILLVYDVSDRRSFESVRGWMRAIDSNAVDGVVRVRSFPNGIQFEIEQASLKSGGPSISVTYFSCFSRYFLFLLSSLNCWVSFNGKRARGEEGEGKGGRRARGIGKGKRGVFARRRDRRERNGSRKMFSPPPHLPPLPFVVGREEEPFLTLMPASAGGGGEGKIFR